LAGCVLRKIPVNNKDLIFVYIKISQVSCDLWYSQRLSKKYFIGIFTNFAYNKISHLEAIKTLFLGFSTVSQYITSSVIFCFLARYKQILCYYATFA